MSRIIAAHRESSDVCPNFTDLRPETPKPHPQHGQPPIEVLVPGNSLGPAPEVDVMAKRPQGLLNVGDSFRADGGAAFLRS
jgi:hypothetical protein